VKLRRCRDYKPIPGEPKTMNAIRNEITRRSFLEASAGAAFYSIRTNAPARPNLKTIRTRTDWQKARRQILDGMQLVMGKLQRFDSRETGMEWYEESKIEELPTFSRLKIRYQAALDDWVPAYLLTPKNLNRPGPAMLCLHQTTKIGKDEPAGLGGNPNLQYAKELAERGFVCIVPDYPYLGENDFDPYQHGYASCTMKGIVNHIRAIDLLQSLPFVSPNRIGAVGHSLGGHNTLFVAAFDPRIRAMVTSCGFTSFRKYYKGDLTGWSGVRYMPRIAEKYGKTWAQMPFDFPEILASLAARPLFINAPLHDANFDVSGVQDCVAAAMRIYQDIFNAGDSLVATYPDAGHEFSAQVRKQAWTFLDRWLKPTK
jgi:dipeptidyl aminopeptidase/acylaminoacyl peptidase